MKKGVKWTWITAGFIVLLGVAFLGSRIFEVKKDIDKMTPVETKRIVDGVYAVRDSYVNLYLVRGETRYIAFDSGNKPETVGRELQNLNIRPSDIAAVFLTHADSDHAGGLPAFPDAEVYLPAGEEQMVDGRTARFFIFKNKLARKHVLIGDNETKAVDGVTVTAIATPGHTPGAACFLVNGQFLFTGDSMSLKSGRAGIFSQAINMDSEAQLESLKKLSKLEGVKTIFTAHHGYSDFFKEAFEDFME